MKAVLEWCVHPKEMYGKALLCKFLLEVKASTDVPTRYCALGVIRMSVAHLCKLENTLFYAIYDNVKVAD